MPLPDFIIAGETKCGTTSMYNNLTQHSKIFPTVGNGSETITQDGDLLGVKEIRFFDRYYNFGWDWYQSRFPKVPDGCITGEATPMYLYRTQALKRMSSVIPNCKIIVMFRDPVRRLVSHYGHIFSLSNDWRRLYPTFDDFWDTAHESDYYMIDKGIYWQTLEKLYQYYQSQQVKIIISEELFTNPYEIYNETLDFLGLEHEDLTPHHSRKNRQQITVRSLSEVEDFYRPHTKILEAMLGRKLPWESR
jgi:hypothetical protein